jgi:predicted acetyltransferase
MSEITYGPPADEREVDHYAAAASDAFAMSLDDSRKWINSRLGVANTRVLRTGRQVAGGLALVPAGQYFGGRRVPMAGVAGVAVLPAHRGGGLARRMMIEMLRELRAAGGMPVSTLYPSTLRLYRAVGYEIAGVRCHATGRPVDLRVAGAHDDGGMVVREARPEDAEAINRVHERRAACSNGFVSRTEYHWSRIRKPRDEAATGLVIECGGEVEGYAYLLRRRLDTGWQALSVTDLGFCTARAGRRLVQLLAQQSSMVREATWLSSPNDPLLPLLHDRVYDIRLQEHWALRLVDVDAALRARGYPPGVTAEVHLDVHDPSLPETAGRRVLRVRDGAGEVEPGGGGGVRIDVRGLAALYTSLLSPGELMLAGLLDSAADAAQTAALGAALAGPAAWMADFF